ncbi:hypothetical protein V2J09_004458 [Rumex salicifolius]
MRNKILALARETKISLESFFTSAKALNLNRWKLKHMDQTICPKSSCWDAPCLDYKISIKCTNGDKSLEYLYKRRSYWPHLETQATLAEVGNKTLPRGGSFSSSSSTKLHPRWRCSSCHLSRWLPESLLQIRRNCKPPRAARVFRCLVFNQGKREFGVAIKYGGFFLFKIYSSLVQGHVGMRSAFEAGCINVFSQQQRTFIQMRTKLNVVDNSGAKQVMCIQALRGKKGARLGDIIVASVKEARPGGKVKKGDVVRAVVVRAAMPKGRCDGSEVKFDDNAVVILNKQGEPVGTRVFGPVPHELRKKKQLKILAMAEHLA